METQRETVRVTTEPGGELVVTVQERRTVRMTPERAMAVMGQIARAVDAIATAHPKLTFGGILDHRLYVKLSRLLQEDLEEWSQTDDDVGAIVTGVASEEAVLLWLPEWHGRAERLEVLDAATVMLSLAEVLTEA